MPSTPTAAPARASGSMNSGCPPLDLPCSAGQLHGMRHVKYHRASGLSHDRKRAHVDDKILVTEGSAALGEDDAVVSRLGHFFHGVDHFPGRKKLSFFQVHHAARLSRSDEQIRLPRKKRGNLQNVGHFGNGSRLGRFMNIRQDRNPKALLDFFQDAQPLGEPRAPIGLLRRAIGLVVRRLEI